MRKFKPFQLRWNEPLGDPACPYAHRWVVNLYLFSIRLHVWKGSDDSRFMHSHPWSFVTIVLRGGYTDVSPGIEDRLSRGSIRFRPAKHKHYVKVDSGGAVTLLITGPQVLKWGYWVNGKLWRPLRYFSKYHHPPCQE